MKSDFPLSGKYTVFDLEIPNLYNDSLCAISMIVIEEGKEILRHTELINPCSFFSPQNIKIHHIRQEDVADQRTFYEFWMEYGPYFDQNHILIAHNVMSDVSVLGKELYRYGIRLQAKKSLDTMDIMEVYLKDKPKAKGDMRLNNICSRFGIYIDHHNPESDANACVEIIRFLNYYHDFDASGYIKNIPEKDYASTFKKHQLQPCEIRPYLKQVKKGSVLDHAPFNRSLQELEKMGHQAFYSHDPFIMMTCYEGALTKGSLDYSVYLRLAVFYRSAGMRNESERILRIGISHLSRKGVDASSLKNYARTAKSSFGKRIIRRSSDSRSRSKNK